jgi:glycolate oxidase iron-sulfur subunit
MAGSSLIIVESHGNAGPAQADLDRCVHCGLCLNACPTYRELGLEMDSPRGRIHQMNQVVNGAPITPDYIQHLDLCLACRGCETACPSGVPYGRMIEAARAHLEQHRQRGPISRWARALLLKRVLSSRSLLQIAGAGLYLYQASGVQRILRLSGLLKLFGPLGDIEALAPSAEVPFFFPQIGKTFPAEGEQRFRVAFLAGCVANVAFARLNEATVRVLQKNGCEVVVPPAQGCCGALAVHAGLREEACRLARAEVDAAPAEEYDAILTNAAGCGSTLKEYGELLAEDAEYREKAQRFSKKVKDVTEFLASIELRPGLSSGFGSGLSAINATVTYQDSCHLAHGQKITTAPRKLIRSVPGITFREMPNADTCCGSAGIYNLLENQMATQILEHKLEKVNATGASIVLSANPGCLLQLRAGVRLYGKGQRVMHVVELLDLAYSKKD